MIESPTVDGRNPANQLRLLVYPTIYRILYIPGGAGFCPSTVSQHSQHLLLPCYVQDIFTACKPAMEEALSQCICNILNSAAVVASKCAKVVA